MSSREEASSAVLGDAGAKGGCCVLGGGEAGPFSHEMDGMKERKRSSVWWLGRGRGRGRG